MPPVARSCQPLEKHRELCCASFWQNQNEGHTLIPGTNWMIITNWTILGADQLEVGNQTTTELFERQTNCLDKAFCCQLSRSIGQTENCAVWSTPSHQGPLPTEIARIKFCNFSQQVTAHRRTLRVHRPEQCVCKQRPEENSPVFRPTLPPVCQAAEASPSCHSCRSTMQLAEGLFRFVNFALPVLIKKIRVHWDTLI